MLICDKKIQVFGFFNVTAYWSVFIQQQSPNRLKFNVSLTKEGKKEEVEFVQYKGPNPIAFY